MREIKSVPAADEGSYRGILWHYKEGVGTFADRGASGGGTRTTIYAVKPSIRQGVLGVACCGGEAAE